MRSRCLAAVQRVRYPSFAGSVSFIQFWDSVSSQQGKSLGPHSVKFSLFTYSFINSSYIFLKNFLACGKKWMKCFKVGNWDFTPRKVNYVLRLAVKTGGLRVWGGVRRLDFIRNTQNWVEMGLGDEGWPECLADLWILTKTWKRVHDGISSLLGILGGVIGGEQGGLHQKVP